MYLPNFVKPCILVVIATLWIFLFVHLTLQDIRTEPAVSVQHEPCDCKCLSPEPHAQKDINASDEAGEEVFAPGMLGPSPGTMDSSPDMYGSQVYPNTDRSGNASTSVASRGDEVNSLEPASTLGLWYLLGNYTTLSAEQAAEAAKLNITIMKLKKYPWLVDEEAVKLNITPQHCPRHALFVSGWP